MLLKLDILGLVSFHKQNYKVVYHRFRTRKDENFIEMLILDNTSY